MIKSYFAALGGAGAVNFYRAECNCACNGGIIWSVMFVDPQLSSWG